jgi:hypothetical protein
MTLANVQSSFAATGLIPEREGAAFHSYSFCYAELVGGLFQNSEKAGIRAKEHIKYAFTGAVEKLGYCNCIVAFRMVAIALVSLPNSPRRPAVKKVVSQVGGINGHLKSRHSVSLALERKCHLRRPTFNEKKISKRRTSKLQYIERSYAVQICKGIQTVTGRPG